MHLNNERERIIYTLGHSNRTFKAFLEILKHYDIQCVIDVRRWPSSRKFPHFGRDYLLMNLPRHGIEYVWLGYALGGKRGYVKGAEKYRCFKAEGYRNYAALMESREWKEAFDILMLIAKSKLSAIVCAERLPWRCHRKLISDALLVNGFKVIHILGINNTIEHKLTKCAKVLDGKLMYI